MTREYKTLAVRLSRKQKIAIINLVFKKRDEYIKELREYKQQNNLTLITNTQQEIAHWQTIIDTLLTQWKDVYKHHYL